LPKARKLSDWDDWQKPEPKPAVTVEAPAPAPAPATPKPNQLKTVRLLSVADRTEEEKLKLLGPFARRWGNVPKGTVLPETLKQACPRVKVRDLPKGHLKKKHIESLEHNQLLKLCCRHPENHEVEALKSHPDELAPDIYIFHCNKCNNKHRFFCVGEADERPMWGCE
jgi:hypothetical protein